MNIADYRKFSIFLLLPLIGQFTSNNLKLQYWCQYENNTLGSIEWRGAY